jgi:hypothetical protein
MLPRLLVKGTDFILDSKSQAYAPVGVVASKTFELLAHALNESWMPTALGVHLNTDLVDGQTVKAVAHFVETGVNTPDPSKFCNIAKTMCGLYDSADNVTMDNVAANAAFIYVEVVKTYNAGIFGAQAAYTLEYWDDPGDGAGAPATSGGSPSSPAAPSSPSSSPQFSPPSSSPPAETEPTSKVGLFVAMGLFAAGAGACFLLRHRIAAAFAGARTATLPTTRQTRRLGDARVNVDEVAAKFLSVIPAARQEKVRRALAIVLPAYGAGSIFNADYKDAKDALNRAVDDAYEENVQKPFLWGKGYTELSKIDIEIGLVMGLYTIPSFAKKVAKLKPPGAYGDALRAFAAAALPLAEVMKELKTKVVMGRKPNPEAAAKRAAIEAKKTMRTCACCFRSIAVLPNGLIADHGYRLPSQWMKTPSCPGGRFRPLEVSSDGLKYMVNGLTSRAETLSQSLSSVGDLKSITTTNWRGDKMVITPESQSWTLAFQNHKKNLELDLEMTRRSLADYKARLASWKPA